MHSHQLRCLYVFHASVHTHASMCIQTRLYACRCIQCTLTCLHFDLPTIICLLLHLSMPSAVHSSRRPSMHFLRPRLYGEKLSRQEGHPPSRVNFSYRIIKKLTPLPESQAGFPMTTVLAHALIVSP